MPWLSLAVLTTDLSAGMRRRVGQNLDTVKAVGIALSDDPLAEAIDRTGPAPGVSRDGRTLAALFALFAEQRSDPVRGAMARNRKTPGEILDRLSRDPAVRIRIDVARNPNTPSSVLSDLAMHLAKPLYEDGVSREVSDDKVLELWTAVARHSRTPEAALRSLAADGFETTVAGNASAPPDLLADLAAQRLATFDADKASQPAGTPIAAWSILPSIATNPATPAEVVQRLAEAKLYSFVVKNPSASAATLAYVVDNGPWDADVLDDVANHPRTPDATLAVIARDPHAFRARDAAARRLSR